MKSTVLNHVALLAMVVMLTISACTSATPAQTSLPVQATSTTATQPSPTPILTSTPIPTTTAVPPTPTITPTLTPVFTEADCPKLEVLCIGLVTQVGAITDNGFNQSAWEGIQRAHDEMNAVVNYIESRDSQDYFTNIGSFVDREYDLIVTIGFSMASATIEAATTYTETYFIGVDQYQSVTNPNLVGLIFHEDQAGFLAGALAANMTKTGIVAGEYGSYITPVVAFHDGFQNGARYVTPDIKILSTYHPTDDKAFSDPQWGATTAAEAIQSGADVIFAAAGQTGNGGLIEVASHPGLFCIGVDIDQWQTLKEAHPCLISSAMKMVDEGVYELFQAYWQGEPVTGNYYGQAGLAPYYDFENLVPQSVKDSLAEIAAALEDGSLSTGYSRP